MASQRIPSPIKRAGHVAVCGGRFILVWGGYREPYSDPVNRYLPTDEIWAYDALLQTWSVEYTHGNIPPGTSGPGCVLMEDSLFVVGGYCEEHLVPSGNTNAVYELHLRTGTWEKINTSGVQPLPCDKMTCWTHEGKIYIFGGFGLNPQSFDRCPIEKIDFVPDDTHYPSPRGWNNQLVIFDPETRSWMWPKWKGPKPVARAAHASAKLGDLVYIFGGRHRTTRMNDMHCFNLSTMTWSGMLPFAEPTPKGRSWHSLTPLNSTKLVLFGGFSQIREALNDCWIFDTEGCFWTQMSFGLLQPRLWHTTCMANQGELVIIGGCVENILSDSTKHANTLLLLYFSPKSLLRIALDSVVAYRHALKSQWPSLPMTVQEMLNKKVKN